MSSKISGVDGSRPASLEAGRISPSAQNPAGGASALPADGSPIHITDAASQLAALEQAVRELPPVDETRVAVIGLAIEQGTYKVSSGRVADKLIEVEHSLSALTDEDL
ncbi:MAG TPA: flagellar biosynthesis anti-sigma factor FlgM [Steroidobacteraceae bacterium]|nr:flagellar biosynthesis anti-sigma factor FlgM [Steroidobacteraceae bacterium]